MKDKKLLIVEDELIIAENLRFMLNEFGYQSVDVAIDADEAQDFFEQTPYDLVLMDINLGEFSDIDGVDLIKLLGKKYTFVHLYVTANADSRTVQKAKDTAPSGYLVKPFVNTAVYANVEVALNQLKKEAFFTFSHKGMQQQIRISEISFIQADGAYIEIHTVDREKHLVRKTLMEFHEAYSTDFIRIHKSTLINRAQIQAYTSRFVIVNDEKITIGRAYKPAFLEEIKSLSFA